MTKAFDNISNKLKDDISVELCTNTRLSIASAYFSIYAFKELKEELKNIKELRFLFTKQFKESYKPAKNYKEHIICVTDNVLNDELEIKLRNELDLKSIAKECAEWISEKVQFREKISSKYMPGFIHMDNLDNQCAYYPISGFNTSELGSNNGNYLFYQSNKFQAKESETFLKCFNEIWEDETLTKDVTQDILDKITSAYKENSPENIYLFILYNIFNEFLRDVTEQEIANDNTGFKDSVIWNKLYEFQKDACLAIINKLEKYNGCILADSVGLGKTFTALSVIKYYENKNMRVLVLCPKKLNNNWTTYKENYKNNPLARDRFNYTVLHHTDINRDKGCSNSIELDRINWGNYDLVVIDESHVFRNGGHYETSTSNDRKKNRYDLLMERVIRSGVKTKILMLSATPVNNRLIDLENQIRIAYEGDDDKSKSTLGLDIGNIFKKAQKTINEWNKLGDEARTATKLLNMLDGNFFKILERVTIARSRQHIEKYYKNDKIGSFPNRLAPKNLYPKMSCKNDAISFEEIFSELEKLDLSIYTPSKYILTSRKDYYNKKYDRDGGSGRVLSQEGREAGIQRLMRINLMKRLESSVNSFRDTICRILDKINSELQSIDNYKKEKQEKAYISEDNTDIDMIDEEDDLSNNTKSIRIAISDIDYRQYESSLKNDKTVLDRLYKETIKVTPQDDDKIIKLKQVISDKIANPINNGNKKVLIFTSFSETANYIYDNLSPYVKQEFDLETALVTGDTVKSSIDEQLKAEKYGTDMNSILTLFSPISKERDAIYPNSNKNIDILIATDCISEGQNLQDCDLVVNFDIHWNPTKIIQRFGRIDRIGSKNKDIQMVYFWATKELDQYIALQNRVLNRMVLANISGGGDDVDLKFRVNQLKKLKEQVIDLEGMGNNITLTDLGLNEFKIDLFEYLKQNIEVLQMPKGVSAVIKSEEDLPKGAVFVLKYINENEKIKDENPLHPYYLVYIAEDGSMVYNHLETQSLLHRLRLACRGKTEPSKGLCAKFNQKTKYGKNMGKYTELLNKAVKSIIEVKEETGYKSLFSKGGIVLNKVKTITDFELICFISVEDE